MSPVSVCMIVANYPPHGGGSERQCALLARHLSRRGAGVTVLTRRLGDAVVAEPDDVTIHRLGSPAAGRWMRAAVFFTAVLRHLLSARGRYQIVHCHGFEPLALAGVATQRLRGARLLVKVVTSGSYGDVARLSAIPGWRMIATLLARADAIVVLNEEARREVTGLGVGTGKIAMIPNGVELPAQVESLPGRNLLYCGRLVAQKNVAGLLRAWAGTRAARSRTLDVVGDGPDRDLLTALSRQLGVAGSVRFHARVADVAPFYARAAGVVLFSHSEGLSNVVLEALAAGRPVIGSDIPGIAELVRHQETGLLVTPGDETALANAIDRLVDEPELAMRLGTAGRALVARHYDMETVAGRMYDLYEQLVAAPSARDARLP